MPNVLERTHTIRDDKCHATVVLTNDGQQSTLTIIVKFLTDDPILFLNYELSGAPAVYLTDVKTDSRYNQNNNVFSDYVEAPVTTLAGENHDVPYTECQFQVQYKPDEFGEDYIRIQPSILMYR